MGFQKTMKIAVAVLLLIVLAAIVRHFLTRSQGEALIPAKKEEITQQKIEKKEKGEYIEWKGAEENVKAKADRHFAGEDGKYYLEGNVEVIFFKRREGRDVFLNGDRVSHDKDWDQIISSGQASAAFKDLTIESSLLNYDNKKEVFSTDKGILFSSQKLEGSAQDMVYQMKQERIRLRENVRLRIKPKRETSVPLDVWGKRLDYDEKTKQGQVEGEVQLFHGESQASAEVVRFELSPDGEQIKTLILEKNAKAYLVAEGKEATASQDDSPFFVRSSRREIEAREIALTFFEGISEVNEVKAKGAASVKFISSNGSFTQFRGETVEFEFDKEGQLTRFLASKSASVTKQGEGPDEQQMIEGHTITKDRESDILWVKGKGDYEARIGTPDREVFARDIAISIDNDDLEVKEGVKVILKSKPDEESAIGMFSKEHPVFVQAEEMRYIAEERRFVFNGDAKAWQEKKLLRASEIVIYNETGNIICTGGVESLIPHTPKGQEEEEQLKISSERMTYIAEENLVTYLENSTLRVKEAILTARSISLYLDKEENDVQKLVARDKVIIQQESGEAQGEEAVYNPEEEALVLTGNPVLIDRNKGKTQGDKLTFYLADGRIRVENKDRERSVTVIKRER
jgi:lipopolysaccharide transport protein LptA